MTVEGIMKYARDTYRKHTTEKERNFVNEINQLIHEKMKQINGQTIDNLNLLPLLEKIKEMKPEDILARKIAATLRAGKRKDDPIKQMIDTLFKLAQEAPLPDKRIPQDPLKLVADAIKNRAEYREVWKEAREILEKKFEKKPEKLAELEPYFDMAINQTFPESKLKQAVKKGLKELNVEIKKLVKEHYTMNSYVRTQLVEKLVRETGLTKDEAQILEHYIRRQMKDLTKEAKEKALANIFKERKILKKTAAQKIQELINLGAFKHETYEDKLLGKLGPVIDQLIREKKINLGRMARKHSGKVDKSKERLVKWILKKDLKVDRKDAEKIAELVIQRYDEILEKRQDAILENMFNKQPGQRKALSQKIIEISNLGGLDKAAYKDNIADLLGLPSLSNELRDYLKNQIEKIEKMEDGYDKTVETAIMMSAIAAEIKPSFVRKIATFRIIAMLLNTKTIIRNLGGNAGFLALENISEITQIPMRKFAEMFLGWEKQEMLSTWESLKAQGKGFKKGWKQGVREAKLGINTLNTNKFEVRKNRTFKKGIMGTAERWLAYGLMATDRAFYMATFEKSLAEQLNLSEKKEITPEMIEIAHELGLYRTFQDNNKISDYLVTSKRNLNKFGFGKEYSDGSKELGMGDLVIPFPKTPGNLLARGLDYSPAGLIFTVMKLRKDTTNNEYLRQKIKLDGFSKAALGTGIMAAGYILANLGIISGSGRDNYDIYSLKESVGLGSYKLNVSALNRWIISGFDPNAAKLQVGDNIATYDWFQPIAIDIAIGADIYDNKDSKSGLIGAIFSSITAGSNTLVDQPVLKGMQEFYKYGNPIKGLEGLLRGVPSSFVPTTLGQVNMLIDNTAKNTYTAKWLNRSFNGAARKIPGAAQQLEPQVNIWGRDRKYYPDNRNKLLAAADIFLNPSIAKQYDPTPEQKIVLDLFESTGEKSQVPKKIDRTIKVTTDEGETIPVQLTTKEITILQRFAGEKATREFREELEWIKDLDKEEQIDELSKILRDIGKEVKEKVKQMRGL